VDKHNLQLLLGAGGLLLITVLASKAFSKVGFPLLLVFIFFGILAGPEGVGFFSISEVRTTQLLGSIALIFILFSGGLSTHLEAFHLVWRPAVVLSSFGVVISTLLMAGLIHFIWEENFLLSALLGATISSTDAAAVFGLFKSRGLAPIKKLRSLLELESGSNDPMAIFLTLGLIQMIMAPEHFTWPSVMMSFLLQMGLGAMLGWVLGWGLARVINWLNLEIEGLYPVLTLGAVMFIYAVCELAGGNGFLSVYLAGISLGREKYLSKKALEHFHHGLGWPMQVMMFLTLGLMVTPSQIWPVMGEGVLISLALMLIARPVSVILCLLPFKFSLREMWFVSWAGPRGATPIILATFLLVHQTPLHGVMFNLIFFIVVTTLLIQGPSLQKMTLWMKLSELTHPERKLPFKSRHESSEFIEYFISTQSVVIGKTIFQLHLPKDVLVILIQRHGQEFIPRGRTVIEPHDRLVMLAAKSSLDAVDKIMGSEHFYDQKLGA
jgi:potassium/hydrogen antiporter